MTTVLEPGTTDALLSYWDATRLRVDDARATSRLPGGGTDVTWPEALLEILKVGYGAQWLCDYDEASGSWKEVLRRSAPSAGALYPFEVAVAVIGERNYLYDLPAGSLEAIKASPLLAGELAEMDFATTPGHRPEALIVFLARPWLSVKKYRLRGYAYCHLDVGHAATNVALYATAAGYAPAVHLRFSRRALARRLGLEGLCREPLAVLCFAGPPCAAAPPGGPGERPAGGRQSDRFGSASLQEASAEELESWDSLSGILSFDHGLRAPGEPGAAPPGPKAKSDSSEVVVTLPAPRVQPSTLSQWCAAMIGRRSAKGFHDQALSLAEVGDLLGGLSAPGLLSDGFSADPAELGLRLVTRKVDGLDGVFAYDARSHSLHRIDDLAAGAAAGRACMDQSLADDAALVLIFHAPIRRLVEEHGYSAFAELHFQASEWAQRLSLAAAQTATVSTTCIGGFDERECGALARLGSGEETVYVMLAGVADESATKLDRLDVAFSHGHTT